MNTIMVHPPPPNRENTFLCGCGYSYTMQALFLGCMCTLLMHWFACGKARGKQSSGADTPGRPVSVWCKLGCTCLRRYNEIHDVMWYQQ